MWCRVAFLFSLSVLSLGTGQASPRQGSHDRTVRTVPMVPDARVRVQATVGHITIVGWDRDELHIEIERHASSTAGLERIETTVVSSDEGREVLISAVQRDGGTDAALSTTLTIHAPCRTAFPGIDLFEGNLELADLHGLVRATVSRGRIVATALSGATRLETTMGDMQLTVTDHIEHPVHLRAFNGNIQLRMNEPPRDARIAALSLSGRITSAIPLELRTSFGPAFGHASLGAGEPMVSLDTVNGDVQIDIGT